jgi:hypothetical protein
MVVTNLGSAQVAEKFFRPVRASARVAVWATTKAVLSCTSRSTAPNQSRLRSTAARRILYPIDRKASARRNVIERCKREN